MPLSLPLVSPANDTLVDQLAEESHALPDWLDFYANLRLRMESTLDQPNGEDRHRGRVRFRVGAKMDVAENLKSEVRLSTTSGTANNPHWDLGGDNGTDTLGGADIVLDRINVTWTPDENLTFKGGKMGTPLKTNPVYGEWIWDDDIQPSGLASTYKLSDSLDARLGYFIIDEQNSTGDSADPAVTVLQLGYTAPDQSLDWAVNTAFWNWTNEGPIDYLVWDTVVSAKADDWTGSVEFIQNLDDDTGEDTGLALGLMHGKGGSQGSSQIFANYFDFDANASMWSVGQDDLPIAVGAQGLSGFIVGYKYWWHDNTTLKLWGLQGDDETNDPLRLRLDLDISF